MIVTIILINPTSTKQWHQKHPNPLKLKTKLQSNRKNVCLSNFHTNRFHHKKFPICDPATKAFTDRPQIDPTISALHQDLYQTSRPLLTLSETKGLSSLTPTEKTVYANSRFLETGAWKTWPEPQQKELWVAVEKQGLPIPLPKPRDLGRDIKGQELGTYSVEEYGQYRRRERQLRELRRESGRFRDRRELFEKDEDFEGKIEEERNRRKIIGLLQGKRMGRYEGNPEWDDVVPIPQDDGEGALAQIAYTDEYAEGLFQPSHICVFFH